MRNGRWPCLVTTVPLLLGGLVPAATYSRSRCDPTSEGSLDCETCPRGKYRSQGVRRRECIDCPRGRYGATSGLASSQCTAECPAGRFGDQPGAQTEEDCKFCPPGRYGFYTGLSTSACTARCPVGKYSSEFGLTSDLQCVICPKAYQGWQCSEQITLRKGQFVSTSGRIGESAHAYIGDNEDIPEGYSPIAFDPRDPSRPLVDSFVGRGQD